MNIAICEDNADDTLLLQRHMENYLKSKSCHGVIRSFSSAEELLAAYSPGAFDLIFLDIYLPGISGMEAARTIRLTDRDCLFVFTTVTPDFSMEGFLVQAGGYMLKPINAHKLETTLHMCREVFERSARVIEIPQTGGMLPLFLSQIEYIEIYGNDALFHTRKDVIKTRMSLSEIEEKLGDKAFLRCHRSYIVNMNHVAEIGEQDFKMTGGHIVPIRKNGKKEIRLALTRFKANAGMGVENV